MSASQPSLWDVEDVQAMPRVRDMTVGPVPAQIDGAVSRGNGNKQTVFRKWRGWSA